MNQSNPIRNPFSFALAVILLTAITAEARIWTSADGKSTFEGDLIAYNAATGDVTVNRAGNRITFKQQALSAGDVAFLKSISTDNSSSNKPIAPMSQPPTPVAHNRISASGIPDHTFTPEPLFRNKPWLIKHFGPVGIGIMLEKDLVMKIQTLEPGSPAEATGKLKQGQVIESINGVKLPDTKRDPRLVLADIITQAEATDGKINLAIQGQGAVTVQIPVLGSYSKTWPLNCPKSDKIVRNLADYIAQNADKSKTEWGSILFLLSTGEEKDLDVVRGWMKERPETWPHNWAVGVQGMGVCEYYLRTGDASVLPLIQKGADHLRDRIYNGGWSGRGGSFNYQSGGHLNAAGVHCVTFLMLAKTCGVNVDEKTFQDSLSHFFDYSGKGSVPYGDYVPKPGFSDCNGKTGGLAMAMAAAARLTPDGENSIYAKAAQISAMKGYYGTHVYHMGHTGGGIGEIWKSTGMHLMADKRPKQLREYTDARRWILELSRRHTGAIGVGGGPDSSYDQASGETSIAWGTFYALNYTLPRKQLHLFGAPLSKWAKSSALPVRPAGSTPADDDFSSPFPVPGGPWNEEVVLSESLSDQGPEIAKKLQDPNLSDETLLTYLHHPEITYRFDAMPVMLKLKKDAILLDLLRSPDARLRHVGIMAVHELFGTWRPSNDEQKARATPEIMAEIDKIIRNPEESGFNKQWAVGLLQHVDLARLRSYRPLLVDFITNGPAEVSAINVSMPLMTDPESYKIMFPPIMKAISTATSYPVSISTSGKISKVLEEASPEIQAYGLAQLKTVFVEQPKQLVSNNTGIYVIPDGATAKRKAIAQSLAFSPEGKEFVKRIPKITLKSYVSGNDSDMYTFNGKFQNEPKYIGKWAWCVWPPASRPDEIDSRIENWINSREGNVKADEKPKDTIELRSDGTAESPNFYGGKHKGQYFWSGNMLFGVSTGEACQMEVRTIGGHDFLIVERGDFAPVVPKEGETESTEVPADFHSGYHIYIRTQ